MPQQEEGSGLGHGDSRHSIAAQSGRGEAGEGSVVGQVGRNISCPSGSSVLPQIEVVRRLARPDIEREIDRIARAYSRLFAAEKFPTV